MKRVADIVGIALVSVCFGLVATIPESELLYSLVSGLSAAGVTLDEWVSVFKLWATASVTAAFSAALLWYVVADAVFKVDAPAQADRRAAWGALLLLPVSTAVLGTVFLYPAQQGAWIAYALLLSNAVACYVLATALFSPATHKYAPWFSVWLRPIRERLPM
jgi:hypothetical protein